MKLLRLAIVLVIALTATLAPLVTTPVQAGSQSCTSNC